MEYLKSKVVRADSASSSEEEESEDEAVNCDESAAEEEKESTMPAQQETERRAAGLGHRAPPGHGSPQVRKAEVRVHLGNKDRGTEGGPCLCLPTLPAAWRAVQTAACPWLAARDCHPESQGGGVQVTLHIQQHSICKVLDVACGTERSPHQWQQCPCALRAPS